MTVAEPKDDESRCAEDLGTKLLRTVREMKAGQAAHVTRIEPNEVAQARMSVGLSQAEFAAALHISKRTLQEWEQGRRSPSGAAQALIRIASRHPEMVRESPGRPRSRGGLCGRSQGSHPAPEGRHGH